MAAQQLTGANVLLLPYCEQLGILLPAVESTAVQWIVSQLSSIDLLDQLQSNQDQHDRVVLPFKQELISRLIVENSQAALAVANLLTDISPQTLYHELVFNTNRYLIHSGLSQLESYLPVFGNGVPEANLVGYVFQRVQELRRRILLFLNHWKCSQATGSPLSRCAAGLDTIQLWYERLFTFSWTVLSNGSGHIQREQWKHLAEMLLNDGFLIGEQPSQVIRTKTNCQVTLHHLGGKTLQNRLTNSELIVYVLSESQAKDLHRGGSVPPERNSAHLEYVGVSLVYNPQTRMMSAEIRNLKIKKIIRPDRRGQDCVLDEKFALLFYFTANSGDFSFMPRVMSVPIVVIVHVNQDLQASATVAWDNAGFEINRLPFCVPAQMPWSRVASVLNRKFASMTGRGLSAENLHYLCEKVICETFSKPVPENQTITWSQFCKDCLPGRKFTFWEWFYAAMKVTRDHFKQHWVDGHVFAFISKSRAEEYLRDRPVGTFVVRFSDSSPGGITIAYTMPGSTVRHVLPFTPRELESLPLAETINNMHDLQWVFQNRPDLPAVRKAAAFGPKSANSPPERRPAGYTGRRNRIELLDTEGNGDGELGTDNGTTNGNGVTLQPADSSDVGKNSGETAGNSDYEVCPDNRQHPDLSLLLSDGNRETGGSTNLLDISYPGHQEPVASTSRLGIYGAPPEPTPEPMEASSTTNENLQYLTEFIDGLSVAELLANFNAIPTESSEPTSQELDDVPPELEDDPNGGNIKEL